VSNQLSAPNAGSADKPKDRNATALNALHTDLKTAARHHETVSATLLGAQLALMTSVSAAAGTVKNVHVLTVLMAANMVGQYLAFALQMTHRRGVHRHRDLARGLREHLGYLIDDTVNEEYEKTFQLGRHKRRGIDLLDLVYPWFCPILSGGLFALAIFLVIAMQ
jgi:hypothetical protein